MATLSSGVESAGMLHEIAPLPVPEAPDTIWRGASAFAIQTPDAVTWITPEPPVWGTFTSD